MDDVVGLCPGRDGEVVVSELKRVRHPCSSGTFSDDVLEFVMFQGDTNIPGWISTEVPQFLCAHFVRLPHSLMGLIALHRN